MRREYIGVLVVGLAIAVGIAFLSPLASGHPDGLERVAEDEGFIDEAEESRFDILPDYSVPGVDNEALSTVLSGIIGVAVAAGLTLLLARYLGRRREDEHGASGSASPPGEQPATPHGG